MANNVKDIITKATSTMCQKSHAASFRNGMNVFNVGAKLEEYGIFPGQKGIEK